MEDWTRVEEGLPNKDTRYAARYGVSVIIFDEYEYKGMPYSVIFQFKDQQLLSLAHGPKGTTWIPASASHWKPYSERPSDAKVIKL